MRKIIATIANRKKNWIGHILRDTGLLKDVIEGSGRKENFRKKKSDLIESTYEEKSGRQSYLEKLDIKHQPDGRELTTTPLSIGVQIARSSRPAVIFGKTKRQLNFHSFIHLGLYAHSDYDTYYMSVKPLSSRDGASF